MKTKHLFWGIIFVCIYTSALFGQRHKKDYNFDLAVTIGLFPTYLKDKAVLEVPPLGLSIDYFVNKNFSLGLAVGYSSSKTDQDGLEEGNSDQWKNNFSAISLRMAAHANKLEGWDFYGGFMLGYTMSKIEVLRGDEEEIFNHKGVKPQTKRIVPTGFIGLKYHLNESLGFFSELGFGITIANIGISSKF